VKIGRLLVIQSSEIPVIEISGLLGHSRISHSLLHASCGEMLYGAVFLTVFFLHVVESCWEGFRTTGSFQPAFAGGFGSGNDNNKKKKGGKARPKTKKGGLAQIEQSPPSKTVLEKKDDQELDKWGLPVTTIEDLFPPLGPDVKLVPVNCSAPSSLSEIEDYLADHINLQLRHSFDEEGIEKKHNKGRIPMKLVLLHKSPPVLQIENFFTRDECEAIKSALHSAHKVDSATFRGALSTRTSTSWFCRFSDVPVLLAKANKMLNIPLEVMEEPQIVRYLEGQEFSWHYDEVPAPHLGNGGQRLATLLVYLNDVEDACGGGTAFRDLHLDGRPLVIQPKEGSALLFFPAFRDGTPDDRTLHRSEAVTCDVEKWIAQMWTHKDAYSAVLPPGNSNTFARSKMDEMARQLGYLDEMARDYDETTT